MILSACLYLIVLSAPLAELLRFEIMDGVFIRFMDVAVALTVFYALSRKPGLMRSNYPVLLLIAALLLSNIPNYWALNTSGLFYALRSALYLCLFFVIPYLIQKTKGHKRLLGVFMASLAGLTFVSFVQYLLYPDLRNLYYLGYDPHSFRLFGPFLDPNLMAIIFTWFSFWLWGTGHAKFLPLPVAALLLTYSRATWLASAGGLLYATLRKSRLAIPALVLALLFVTAILLLPRRFGEGTNLLRTNSLYGKRESWIRGYELFIRKPILGYGFNNIPALKPENVGTGPQVRDNAAYGLDNSLLTILVTVGIVGLTAYLYLIYRLFVDGGLLQRLMVTSFFLHSLSVNGFFAPGVLVYFVLFYYFSALTQRR